MTSRARSLSEFVPNSRPSDVGPPRSRKAIDIESIDQGWEQEELGRQSMVAPLGAHLRLSAPPCELRADVYESPHAVLLFVDLPGVAPPALKLGLKQKHLTVEARSVHGRVDGFLRVPEGTGAEAIDAVLKDGVLRLRISKAPPKPRRIDVHVVVDEID